MVIIGLHVNSVKVNIEEIRKPELDAKLVAESIAQQLERRVMFRRAMKRAIQNTMRMGAQGIKIKIGGGPVADDVALVHGLRESLGDEVELRPEPIDFGLELDDLGAALRDYRQRTDFDPRRLDELEARKTVLERLLLKYGPDEAAALAHREAAAHELDAFNYQGNSWVWVRVPRIDAETNRNILDVVVDVQNAIDDAVEVHHQAIGGRKRERITNQ